MSYFSENFSDVIPEHLEHVISLQVSLKSDVVTVLDWNKISNTIFVH